MTDAERKAYPLRVDPALWAAVERCAAAELRSVNAQVECLLREALAAVVHLVLGGEASWDDPPSAHADFLREFVRTQGVQTNEVQRSWVLLPLFLHATRPVPRLARTAARPARPA